MSELFRCLVERATSRNQRSDREEPDLQVLRPNRIVVMDEDGQVWDEERGGKEEVKRMEEEKRQ